MNDTVALLISLYTGFGLFFTIIEFHKIPSKAAADHLKTALLALCIWPAWIAFGLYQSAADHKWYHKEKALGAEKWTAPKYQ